MATHFARGTFNADHLISPRLSEECHNEARELPEHRRHRFLASRSLLAELVFMLYGLKTLPSLSRDEQGRPHFSDAGLADFSLSYAGNLVGVALTTDGRCGLGMELQRAARTLSHPLAARCEPGLTSNETIWIANQNDPVEAKSQLMTLRRSVLKLTGQPKQELQLLPGAGRLRVADTPNVEAVCDAEDVLVWAIAVSPTTDKLKVWEFDMQQGWRGLPDTQKRTQGADARLMRFTSLPAEKALILN
ncbi:4'-phosphopantetheinyl transferase family protein [Franconibacter pulveris]|uniref:4'-phosphopantetheinyl transferase family protein n=1 Tax=Franconibacter pulveris TaxID=435910 RepID=UPI0004964E4F|nr:hypothetical protein [Franconibacter pulveris]HBI10868.1 hypothetical protein [Franconibacter pulveris]